MLVEIECFVNWIRRRNPDARAWRDYRNDLQQFAELVGDRPLEHDIRLSYLSKLWGSLQ